MGPWHLRNSHGCMKRWILPSSSTNVPWTNVARVPRAGLTSVRELHWVGLQWTGADRSGRVPWSNGLSSTDPAVMKYVDRAFVNNDSWIEAQPHWSTTEGEPSWIVLLFFRSTELYYLNSGNCFSLLYLLFRRMKLLVGYWWPWGTGATYAVRRASLLAISLMLTLFDVWSILVGHAII
jgi:hypothetical protein